jgi:hypothetical protein
LKDRERITKGRRRLSRPRRRDREIGLHDDARHPSLGAHGTSHGWILCASNTEGEFSLCSQAVQNFTTVCWWKLGNEAIRTPASGMTLVAMPKRFELASADDSH